MSMFEIINRKPEPIKADPALLSEPLMHAQLESLKYISVLLERISWIGSPGRLEFEDFQKMLREHYAVQIGRATAIHGNGGTQPVEAPRPKA